MTQKEGISVKFSEGMGIFDHHFGYLEIDHREKYNEPTGKVKEMQGIQAHAEHDFLIHNTKSLVFDLDNCQYFIKIRET